MIAVEFNYDGKMIAAGDMSGVVKVWKIINSNGLSFQEMWSEYVEDILVILTSHIVMYIFCLLIK